MHLTPQLRVGQIVFYNAVLKKTLEGAAVFNSDFRALRLDCFSAPLR
jgi:hypothetical protein